MTGDNQKKKMSFKKIIIKRISKSRAVFLFFFLDKINLLYDLGISVEYFSSDDDMLLSYFNSTLLVFSIIQCHKSILIPP